MRTVDTMMPKSSAAGPENPVIAPVAIGFNPIRQHLNATHADTRKLINSILKPDCGIAKATSDAAIAVHSASVAILNCLLESIMRVKGG